MKKYYLGNEYFLNTYIEVSLLYLNFKLKIQDFEECNLIVSAIISECKNPENIEITKGTLDRLSETLLSPEIKDKINDYDKILNNLLTFRITTT